MHYTLMLDRGTGRPRGFALVEMSSPAEVQAAIAQFDGRELGGRALKVNQAEDRGAGGRGGSSRARW